MDPNFKKNMEENRKVLIYRSVIGNYSHDKLNINVNNLNSALKNDYATISKTFKSKQLESRKSCLNLEKLRDSKRNKTNKLKKLTNTRSFYQEDNKLRSLLDVTEFRTLTQIKRERKDRKDRKEEGQMRREKSFKIHKKIY